MPLTSSVVQQMMARFRNFWNLKNSQDLVLKGAVRFEQVQRFIWAKKIFWGYGHFKGLFTWREGALAIQATRLEGVKHSPPLHATHLTRTVSGLRDHELSFEWPLSTTNITADEGNFFSILFQLPAWAWAWPVLCLRLVYYIDHFVRQITLANGNYKKTHLVPPCFCGLSHMVKSYPA